ncbi:hypothetical protein BDV93DRAFT_311725 [Ceratobasidium sp. AG-I]|nr:hypothetical protein BDV93DRAFT_311725 [Ceratobasidium sp. AG-I]
MSKQEREAAISLVISHVTYLRSLSYVINYSNDDRSIVACWLKCGTPGSLTRLSVLAMSTTDDTFACLPDGFSLSNSSFDEFHRPIQSLTLSYACME